VKVSFRSLGSPALPNTATLVASDGEGELAQIRVQAMETGEHESEVTITVEPTDAEGFRAVFTVRRVPPAA
jgi:hypothetical protein